MNITEGLNKLADLVVSGQLRKGNWIDTESFVCFTGFCNGFMGYHQYTYEQLPLVYQKAFRGRKIGDKIANCRIIGVYDLWDSKTLLSPHGQDFDID